MKKIIKQLVDYPFGTAILISALSSGAAKIIRAVKGSPTSPGVVIQASKKETENT